MNTDVAALFISAALVLGYHFFLQHRLRRDPLHTIQAVTALARERWVAAVMSSGRQDVLAIQTLRNSIMAATFLASTAMLVTVGTLTLAEQGQQLAAIWHALNPIADQARELWLIKLIFLVCDFLFAFFSFTMAIRLYNHVGYMINLPASDTHIAHSPRQVAFHLNRAASFFTAGVRAYYFAVPLLFWLFGPHLLLAATLALIFVLYRIDRVPDLDEA